MRAGRGASERVFTVFTGWLMVVGASAVLPAQEVGAQGFDPEAPDWAEELEGREKDYEGVPDSPPWVEGKPAPRVEPEGVPPLPEPDFPEAAAWDVSLRGEGERAAVARGTAGPVAVAAGVDGVAGERLEVEVLDRASAERLGVPGFLFEVSEAAGSGDGVLSEEAAGDDGLPTELTVDYSGFKSAYGGGFAGRLVVVALPDCVLEDPVPEDCDVTGTELPTRVDRKAEQLVVEVEDMAELAVEGVEADRPSMEGLGLSEEEAAELPVGAAAFAGAPAQASGPEAGGVVFGVMSSHESGAGDYAASPLSLSGSWQVSPGSGEFSYGYPIGVPEPPAGGAPEVGLGYSSGAVDGLVSSGNTQSPMAGVGWSGLDGPFIERHYESCWADHDLNDLCWGEHNAVISLNGVTEKLVAVDDVDFDEWRLEGDPGWRVERLTGADNDDNEGEHWKVTTPDGTQYFFGLGEDPLGGATDSTLIVPVFGDGDYDCALPDGSFFGCDQAWRWNLDRVVDPNGNVISYDYIRELNHYRALNGIDPAAPYHRGGRLAEISYGWQTGDSVPAARVVLGAEHRCNSLSPSCPAATSGNASQFPDVPNDLICSSSCLTLNPTFFTTKRYSYVQTEVRVGSQWKEVERHNLIHDFYENTDEDEKLYLEGIQREGLWKGTSELFPPVTFELTELPNRVDVDLSEDRPPMGHFRITEVVNEYGGSTEVTYGQKSPCSNGYDSNGRWDQNVKDCFPVPRDGQVVYTLDPIPAVFWRWDHSVFNKYLVMEIVESPEHGSPPITTTYTYEGDPGWRFDYDIFRSSRGGFVSFWSDFQAWSVWRGYHKTTVEQGISTTEIQVFQGMHNDLLCNGTAWYQCPPHPNLYPTRPTRDVSFDTYDDSISLTDLNSRSGLVVGEARLGTLDGTPDTILEWGVYQYERRTTVNRSSGPTPRFAYWNDLLKLTEGIATAPEQYRKRRTQTTYNAELQPETMLEEGWLDVTGDERCSVTTYAENPGAWMLAYPSSETALAGDCESTEELAVTETYYDDSTTLGAPPTNGNPTLTRVQLDASTWSETETVYDSRGRPVEVTDPNGATTTTSFVANPANAIPSQTTVTNDLGHTTVTDWVVELQAPDQEQDPNGEITSFDYDAFGRTTEVRLPTEQPPSSGEPSLRFSYLIDPTKTDPPVVRTQRLTSDATSGPEVNFEDSWVVYDGLLRERQTHALSPEAGKVIVAETTYDGRGLVLDETATQAVTGTAGDGLIPVASWDNRTRNLYDALGRPTSQEWWRDTTVAWETSFDYTENTVTTTPPEGGQVREKIDGLGRTVEVSEHDGSSWVTSSYSYDLADNLTSVSDPEGNTINYTYNMAGWRLTQDDPNRGTAQFGYDPTGNQTSTIDAEANEVHMIYDPLGRPIERRADSPTGTLLASWEYDEPGELGLLHSETSHTSGGDWVTETTGYDERSRPQGTTLTVPAGVPGLSGSYTVTKSYDRADRVTEVNYPAVGGLPGETVTTTYDDLGLARELIGSEAYVWWADYDDRGRPEVTDYGDDYYGEDAWLAQFFDYDADQRLNYLETWMQFSGLPGGLAAVHELHHDDLGNVTAKDSTLNGADWRECYDYDERHRLVEAFTVELFEDCSTGAPGTGDNPFEHSYTYSPDGKSSNETKTPRPTPTATRPAARTGPTPQPASTATATPGTTTAT